VSPFNGLIQHSFALENHKARRPFRGYNVKEMVCERFALPAFKAAEFPAQVKAAGPNTDPTHYGSPLLERGLTTLDRGRRARFLKRNPDGKYAEDLPVAFSWANARDEIRQEERRRRWDRLVFAKQEANKELSYNDFLVTESQGGEPQAQAVSELLCELLGARRSMLFGLALANRFVNVMLPHARLTPVPEGEWTPTHHWILQPLISLVRVGHEGLDFRRMYSLSFFLIPVKGPECNERKMSDHEMDRMVNAGWGLAASPTGFPEFKLHGPLSRYVTLLEPEMGREWRGLTLRRATEAVAFAVALRMAQGRSGTVKPRVREEIGDEVVSAFGNSRVSSVLAVDRLDRTHLDNPRPGKAFPRSLESVMGTLAGRARIPSPSSTPDRRYRLDRPYIDHEDYAIGVLPSNRCLVMISDRQAQFGRWDSGLMQAAWIAYTAIGAAGAIGTMRAINRDLEIVDRSNPNDIAAIEHEVAVDLHEIYDLDITWEAFRLRYRRLRKQLGITSDYEALRGKLEALYRETSAHFEARSELRLLVLTAAIVALSFLILAGTILLALEPK
jgi:hypothetical protein